MPFGLVSAWNKRRRSKSQDHSSDPCIYKPAEFWQLEDQTPQPTKRRHGSSVFTLKEMEEATCSFSDHNLLGKGGFGKVYRGTLRSGEVVAIKKMELPAIKAAEGEREFRVEVDILSMLDHPNLVSLIGYSADGKHRFLVYEYMLNGNLQDHLNGIKERKLDWPLRLKVALGAAKGLAYLHTSSCVGIPIVHRDFKSTNILLNANFEAKGSKIHITVKKTLIYKFKRLFKEGEVYSIAFFGVNPNTGEYKTTRHDFKVNLNMNSEVQLLKDVDIGLSPYTIVSFPELSSDDYDTTYLADVMGVLTGVGNEREWQKDRKKMKMNVIELDAEGLKIECALFDNYVEHLNTFLSSGDTSSAVILIQFAKVKPFQGKVSILNANGATRIVFNPEMDEARELKEKFSHLNDPDSFVLSQIHDCSKVSAEDDFLSFTARMTLTEIKDCTNNCSAVVHATIKHALEGEEWWYMACRCNKKVFPDENMYFCENCNRHVVAVSPRYRLKLRVMDDNDVAPFVVFDQEAGMLLGKSCVEMIEQLSKDGHGSGLPSEIVGLVGKSFLFKVDVRNNPHNRFEPSYRVKRLCADPLLIEHFIAPVIEASSGSSSLCMSLTTPTPQFKIKDSMNGVSKDLLEDFVVVSVNNNSQAIDSVDVDLGEDSEEITPQKRSSPPEFDSLGSCNLTKKKIVAVKKEKM